MGAGSRECAKEPRRRALTRLRRSAKSSRPFFGRAGGQELPERRQDLVPAEAHDVVRVRPVGILGGRLARVPIYCTIIYNCVYEHIYIYIYIYIEREI